MIIVYINFINKKVKKMLKQILKPQLAYELIPVESDEFTEIDNYLTALEK